jgi:hypothetical protein
VRARLLSASARVSIYEEEHAPAAAAAQAYAPRMGLKVNWTISLSHQLVQIIKLERWWGWVVEEGGQGVADHTPPCPGPPDIPLPPLSGARA